MCNMPMLADVGCCWAQVTHAVLKDGTKIEAQMVIAGVGARPNVELFEGQIDLLKDKPGGIKVRW